MAMNVSRSSDGTIAEINVTPMADVMIVLLIIFMVTVPLIKDMPLPPAENSRPDQEKGALVIVLEAKGELVVDRDRLGPYEAALAQVTERARTAAGPVWIKADRSVPYRWVGAVLDACKLGGTEDVYLATNPPEVQG